MNVYDQAAHLATLLERTFVLGRVNELAGLATRFRTWFDTKTASLPRETFRIADLVALMDDAVVADRPWLYLHEFQATHDPTKLGSMLIAAAIFRERTHDPDDAERAFRVLPVLIYLKGLCPQRTLDMRTPNGHGIAHQPVVWELDRDSAHNTLQAVETGRCGWGALFWVPLMAGGGTPEVLQLFVVLLDTMVPDKQRQDVAYIALEFAELAGCRPVWDRLLEGRNVTESTLYKQVLQRGKDLREVELTRDHLLLLLTSKFRGGIPNEYTTLIRNQESFALLDSWYRAALAADNAAAFLAVLRQ